ncbi:MAG: nucleotidyltransferase substrate binding protein [bacterium]
MNIPLRHYGNSLRNTLKRKKALFVILKKACFREIFGLGFLTEEETIIFLDMTDRRNDTSHTYKEEVALLIYSKIKGYSLLMKGLLAKFEGKI